MRAGRMDRRITIQRRTDSQDSYGEPIAAWSTLLTVWAEVRSNSGGENYKENQFQAVAPVTFRVRWSNAAQAIRATDRVSYDGRTHDITAIREIGRREGLELDAFARAETAVATD